MDRRPSVIVVGGGFAGAELARRLGRRANVTLVSGDNFLLFTPLLAEAASGDVDPRHITAPLRQLCPDARLVQGDVVGVDVAGRSVTVRPPLERALRRYEGDALVLAGGSIPATYGVPGVGEWTLPFKTIADALRIRNRVLAALETATEEDNPHLVSVAVVGAGYSGVELAASLADFFNEVGPRYYPAAPTARVTLVDASERVTPMLPERLSRAAHRALEKRRVTLELGRAVEGVDDGGLVLAGGGRVEAATVVWSGGVRAGALAGESGLPAGGAGRLTVDDHLRAAPGVFALGDMALVPDGHGGMCPPTAQHALRQGRYLGKHLPDLLAGRMVRPFRYRTMGMLAAVGHRNAVGTVFGIGVAGFPAWFLWRSYYLWRLPTALRKARVAIDWSLDLFFPHDIAGLPTSDLGPTPRP